MSFHYWGGGSRRGIVLPESGGCVVARGNVTCPSVGRVGGVWGWHGTRRKNVASPSVILQLTCVTKAGVTPTVTHSFISIDLV